MTDFNQPENAGESPVPFKPLTCAPLDREVSKELPFTNKYLLTSDVQLLEAMTAARRFLNCCIFLMCVCTFTEAIALEMTSELRRSFLDQINAYRAQVEPPAKTMMALVRNT